MIDLSNPNLLIFAGALVFGLLLVWYLFGRSSAPRERSYKPDVLDEGAAPAKTPTLPPAPLGLALCHQQPCAERKASARLSHLP